MYKVYDKRTNETLKTGTEWDCMEFILENHPEGTEMYKHLIIGKAVCPYCGNEGTHYCPGPTNIR